MMMLFLLVVVFISSIQPIFMVSSLIMITVLYSYNMYVLLGGYWFSYALVMVMLSGVLVVFTYMASLIPNESFENYVLVYLFMFLFMLLVGWLLYNSDISYLSLFLWISCFSIYNLFMVSFLLGIMLLVVWFSNMGMGSIRISYLCAWFKSVNLMD